MCRGRNFWSERNNLYFYYSFMTFLEVEKKSRNRMKIVCNYFPLNVWHKSYNTCLLLFSQYKPGTWDFVFDIGNIEKNYLLKPKSKHTCMIFYLYYANKVFFLLFGLIINKLNRENTICRKFINCVQCNEIYWYMDGSFVK